jgi:hypothetical protein
MVELVSKLGVLLLNFKKKQYLNYLKRIMILIICSIFGMPEENDWILNGLGFDHL